MKIAPRRQHARRPFPWPLVTALLGFLVFAEAFGILELLRYIAIMP
jgi:hypothetical protein